MRIVVFPGDGIGPEITLATLDVLSKVDSVHALGLDIRMTPVGLATLEAEGTTIPRRVWADLEWAHGAVLGPLSTHVYPGLGEGGRNLSSELRTGFNLYANIRPARSRPGHFKQFDLVVVRENTEGFYAVRTMHCGAGEFMPDPDTGFAIRKITRNASRRIAETAFRLARQRNGRVTVVHKANVLKLTDGIFKDEVERVAVSYPDIDLDDVLVDAAASFLVRAPERFDVLLTTNLFGDILSNLAAEVAGGLGIGPSLNASDTFAIAQAAHGSAPDIAGKNTANPTALILSAAMLLRWHGKRRGMPNFQAAADEVERRIFEMLGRSEDCTADLGGPLTTIEFTKRLVGKIGAGRSVAA